SQPLRREPEKSRTRFQDLSERLFLEGNSRDHQVRLYGCDLGRIRGPRIGQNCAGAIGDTRYHVSAVAGASDDTLEFENRIENHGRARLQARNASWRVVDWHNSILNVSAAGQLLVICLKFAANRERAAFIQLTLSIKQTERIP